MNSSFLSSVEVKKQFLRHTGHELTICLGDNAYDNLKASLAHAKVLLESRKFDSVIYINIPFASRRVTDACREVYPQSERDQRFILLNMRHGRLGPDFNLLRGYLDAAKGNVAIIINSWEMASSSYRYKEMLLFAIHELICASDLAVFVYSQAKSGSVKPGYIHRSGLGKLTSICDGVIELPKAQEETATADEPKVFIEDIVAAPQPQQAGECVVLHDSKINELAYADET